MERDRERVGAWGWLPLWLALPARRLAKGGGVTSLVPAASIVAGVAAIAAFALGPDRHPAPDVSAAPSRAVSARGAESRLAPGVETTLPSSDPSVAELARAPAGRTIEGIVRDASASPIAGARVHADWGPG